MQSQEGISYEIDSQGNKKAHSPEEATEMLRFLVQNCVTKDDLKGAVDDMKGSVDTLRGVVGESEYRLKDHVSREVAKIRDIEYRQNEKTNEVVRVIQKEAAISKMDGVRLIAINPFKD